MKRLQSVSPVRLIMLGKSSEKVFFCIVLIFQLQIFNKTEQNITSEKQHPCTADYRRGSPEGRASLVSLLRSTGLAVSAIDNKKTADMQAQVPNAGAFLQTLMGQQKSKASAGHDPRSLVLS